MKNSNCIFAYLILLSLLLINENIFPSSKNISYKETYNQLINLEADPAKSAVVSNLMIKRDVATFKLESGVLSLCTPVNGKVCAAIFMGTGSFIYTPPSEVEKEQLGRFYEQEEFNHKFDFLFLMFADSTLTELEGKLNFGPAENKSSTDAQIESSVKFLSDESTDDFDTDLMITILENKMNGAFFAYFNSMFFEIDPLETEEVLLERPEVRVSHHNREVINQFSASGNPENVYPDFKIKERYNYTAFNITSTIENDLDFIAAAELEFTPAVENQHWIHFYLYEDLDVDSVFLDKNKSEFFRGDGSEHLWVKSTDAFKKNNQYKLKIYYHGDLLERNDLSWITLKSSDYWYPRIGYRQKVRYNLTFHYPSKYQFAASGENIFSKDSEEMTTSIWNCAEPSRNASFNIGLFDEFTINSDSTNKINVEDSHPSPSSLYAPAVTVYINRTGLSELRNYFAPQGIILKGNMEEQIGGEVVNSCRFYENLFGPVSLKHIYATPISYYHGEAFPGLIHLSWITYQGLDSDVGGMIFRAHEVAHQWWGIGVDFKTYHDQWLSEGFAEYSGLWYVQAYLKDNENFFDVLDKWKDDIFSNRKYIFGSGQEAGPIILGYRTQSRDTKGDYDLIVYKKGAWVLHMLRIMLLDIKTMNEDKFKSLLREFYTNYRNKEASTEDFKKLCDKYFNEDMSWFFNQWIYGTKIPEYIFSYKTKKTPEGKYNITCRIKQENVPDDFKIYTILLVKFDDDKLARLRIKVTGPVTEFTFPSPLEPDEIIFDDLHSTLCKYDYEDWKD